MGTAGVAFSVPATYLAFGLAPNTPRPTASIRPIIGGLAVVILIIDRQHFKSCPRPTTRKPRGLRGGFPSPKLAKVNRAT